MVSGQYCAAECALGQYEHAMSHPYMLSLNIAPSFWQKQHQFADAIMLTDASYIDFKQCRSCQHNLTTGTFAFVQSCDATEECFTVDTHCTVRCQSLHIQRNNECILCNHTECAVGSFKQRSSCACAPCTHSLFDMPESDAVNFTSTHVQFVSNGAVLDEANSCDEECKPGFFQDTGMVNGVVKSVCVPHTSLNCSASEILLPGTQFTDVQCQACQYHCEHMLMISNCSHANNSQSVCLPCNDTVLENEEFVHSNCTKQCVAGTMRDEQARCAVCDRPCAAGYRLRTAGALCGDCVECNTKPLNNSYYIDNCLWSCAAGYEFNDTAWVCEEVVVDLGLPIVYQQKSFVTYCPLGFYVKSTWAPQAHKRTECVACETLGVITPDASLQGASGTWNWVVTGGENCVWECTAGRYKFNIDPITVTCYTWNEFADSVGGVTSVQTSVSSTDPEATVKFDPNPRQEVVMLTDWKIGLLCVAVLITVRMIM